MTQRFARRARLLAASSIIAAPALLAAGAAAAQGKEGPIQVGIGGYFYGYFAGVSQDDGAATATQPAEPGNGTRNYGIFRKSRIQFNGLSNLDNGLKVGFRVQLRGEANTNDQIDQSYLFFDSQFGRFELGKERGAAYSMHYAAPEIQSASADPWNLNFGDFNGLTAPAGNLLNGPGGPHSSYIELGRSEKIAYYTPRFAGFQAGISFAPDGCWVGGGFSSAGSAATQGAAAYSGSGACTASIGDGFAQKNNPGQQSDVVGVGLNYVNRLGPVDLAASLGYMGANVEGAPGINTSAYRNEQAWNAGLNIGYAGFTLGGAFAQDNNGVNRAATAGSYAGKDAQYWNVGLVYAWDRWRVGVSYLNSEIKAVDVNGANLGKDKWYGVELGGGYTLGPGIALTGGAEYQKYDTFQNPSSPTYAASKNEGWVYQVGTTLRF
ncbi:MAG: porin [Alphaproteobacteria bacterium]|jgi:predicted porin|nr:porin [Alphaproteobacteria bacterium]